MDNETNALLLLKEMPLSELEPHQIAVTENGKKLPTFQFVREPSTINELALCEDGEVVWMRNGTLILLNRIEIFTVTDPLPVVQYSKYFVINFCFDDDTETTCQIFGDAEHNILDTAFAFASLEVSEERKMTQIMIKFDQMRFTGRHWEQLSRLLEFASTKNIIFRDSNLVNIFSAVIATRPFSVALEFDGASLDFPCFMDHLENRTTCFGSLKLDPSKCFEEDLGLLLDHPHLFDHFDLPRVSSDILLKLLRAPMKCISFNIGTECEGMDLRAANIVATEIVVNIAMKDELPALFLVSFLERVAELGRLESLAIHFYDGYNGGGVPVEVGNALTRAVAANKNLRTLELCDNRHVWDVHLADIFGVLQEHESLQALYVRNYPRALDRKFIWLMRLLKRNPQIEITADYKCTWKTEIVQIEALLFFFRASLRLTREPPSIRPSLVKVALTHSAANDVQRIGMLLNDHTDVLNELLQDIVFTNDDGDGATQTNEEDVDHSPGSASFEGAEQDNGLKRKRKIDS